MIPVEPYQAAAGTLIPAVIAPLVFYVVSSNRGPNHSAEASIAFPATVAGSISEPVTRARDFRESTIEFHTWPPTQVYVNNRFLTEAPSPKCFPLTPGGHTVRLITKDGRKREFAVHLAEGQDFTLKFNFDDGQPVLEMKKP